MNRRDMFKAALAGVLGVATGRTEQVQAKKRRDAEAMSGWSEDDEQKLLHGDPDAPPPQGVIEAETGKTYRPVLDGWVGSDPVFRQELIEDV